MEDQTAFTFKTDSGEERSINSKDLIAVIPSSDESLSTIIYVQHDEKDDTVPPNTVIVKGDAEPNVQPQDTSDEETHIIVSTGSGTNKAKSFYEQALRPVLETLFPKGYTNFLTHYTESATTIQELTNDIFFPTANAGITLRIILLAGDGGVIDLANGLLSRRTSSDYKAPQVVLVPLGTANALYHSINAGKDNTWGLRALTSTRTKPLPILSATFSPGARLLTNEGNDEEELSKDGESGQPILHGAVVCSWAMHATLVADSDTTAYRKYGIDRFKMAAKEALYPADGSPPHAYRGTVSVLHASRWTPLIEEEHMYVLATMVSNLEKLFCISPNSEPLDGSMALVQFAPMSGDEAMRIMGLAYQGGKHVEDLAVRYEEIDGLKIEFKEKEGRWRRVCVDGKIVKVEEGGWVGVRKEERRVLDVVVG
ncbi:hypothetical protein BU23DRAFT_91035 [Bimuria novae-zelandiae CBS 107.79]|uniref:DAGKc domain-containing protein n=1 Tax=Bimuria novae-zelandiae CBS 107.79 TaxID=1447943 RepID=A0A6A5VI95_9PLEO|nr:hypothetical protein BU23DRAFT_91035 [Bimuria novae-zelandiae CBS 107.79]